MNQQEEIPSQELLKAQAHVWSHTFSFVNSMFLKCAVDLGIPDAIHRNGHPMSLASLADALSIPDARRGAFRRLMNLLSHSGFFALERVGGDEVHEEEQELFSLTTSSLILVKDKEWSIGHFVTFIMDPKMMDGFPFLSAWLQQEEASTAFEVANGRGVWEETSDNPTFNTVFNRGMATDASFISRILVRDHGQDIFGSLHSIVDVGGGTGTLARAIAEAFPHIKCVVLDLPQVIVQCKPSLSCPNLDFIAGDMFKSIPRADAVLLKWILHDWSDEECMEILKKCKEATPSKEEGGKVIVVDIMMTEDSGDEELLHTQLLFDGYIMTDTTGMERYQKQWKKMFMDAGFKGYRVLTVLGARAVMEVYH